MAEQRTDVVPGLMYCAKCKLQIGRTNLYNQGTSGPGDNKTEPCLNGCGPMWPVTWEMHARAGWEVAERYFDELKRLKDAQPAAAPELSIDDRILDAFGAVALWGGPNLTRAINAALAAAPQAGGA